MSLLHLDAPERPDYVPIPSVVLTAVGLGCGALLLTAVLAQTMPLAQISKSQEERSVSAPSWVAELRRDFGEPPHTHNENGDPTPRSVQADRELSTSGPSVPFIPMDDSANMSIILRHARERHAAYLRASAMSSTWSPALWAGLPSTT